MPKPTADDLASAFMACGLDTRAKIESFLWDTLKAVRLVAIEREIANLQAARTSASQVTETSIQALQAEAAMIKAGG